MRFPRPRASMEAAMAIDVVRLGTPRRPGEGLRLGTVRRPPRGVRKDDLGALDYYDVWLPELAPAADLVSWAMAEEFTPARWVKFERQYVKQMREPAARRLLALLAALSLQTSLAVGCYCEDEARCHRSILRRLLVEGGAMLR